MTTQNGQVIQVLDSAEPLEFTGVKLSSVSTRGDASVRWTSMDLYRLTAGPNTGSYVLHIEGRSNVYHLNNGPCNSGVPVDVDDLEDEVYEEISPCTRCRPPRPRDIIEGDLVDLEENRYTNHICSTGAQVIAKLRDSRSGAGGSISGPGQRLLAIAARADDGIARAITAPRKL